MRRVLLAAVVIWALVPATAHAGGWATVGLSSTPDGLRAGEAWVVDVEVLQHGMTPLRFIEPQVVLRDAHGAGPPPVAARPTSKAGIYRARVVFPAAGRWSYEVRDGFSRTHRFAPVQVDGQDESAAAAGRPADGGFPWGALLAAAAAGLAAAGLTAMAQRRRAGAPGTRPAPTGA